MDPTRLGPFSELGEAARAEVQYRIAGLLDVLDSIGIPEERLQISAGVASILFANFVGAALAVRSAPRGGFYGGRDVMDVLEACSAVLYEGFCDELEAQLEEPAEVPHAANQG